MGCCGIKIEEDELKQQSKNFEFQKTIAFLHNNYKKGYGIFCKIPFVGIKSIVPVLISPIDLI
jgi:hypothetical protein